MLDRDTTLVGHSIESDLRALRLVHRKVVDTSALFPHPRGAPFKKGLKHLSAEVLGVAIQAGEGTAAAGRRTRRRRENLSHSVRMSHRGCEP